MVALNMSVIHLLHRLFIFVKVKIEMNSLFISQLGEIVVNNLNVFSSFNSLKRF